MDPLTIGLISAGVSSLGSAFGAKRASENIDKARSEENRSYQEAKDYLASQYYRDPLSTVGNRALLKTLDQRMKDQTAAMENRAAASGATFENQLAARQANNEVMSGVYANLLQGEDARRQAIEQQRFALDQRHSANLQNGYIQNAQNWQAWGGVMGDTGMALGNALILGKQS